MHLLPTEIYSVAAVRSIDRCAIDEQGIAGYTLMTRAAQAALGHAQQYFPGSRRWLVLCGSGNNGGDGYVFARLALASGIDVKVVAVTAPDNLNGDAALAYKDYVAAGGRVEEWKGSIPADVELIVDAMLGSGLMRDVGGSYADAVVAINSHPASVMALDIPTGINGDSGAVLGVAVLADLTTTFVGVKQGLLLGEGLAHTGKLLFAGLDIPDSCYDEEESMLRRIELDGLRDVLPKRARDAHKGSNGHVLLVAGGQGMPGAARLCGEAALRAGAGLVSLATHPSHSAEIAASRPELICHPLESAAALAPLLAQATVVALGPGLGQSDWAIELFEAVLRTELPLVVDADALNLLATKPQRRDNWILTPHPGEAARLLGRSSREVQADRPSALLALHERYAGTVVLKGAGTLVSSQSGSPWICLRGNPGMASAGMGDVLTGIIAGLVAQGLSLEQAAVYGVEVHAAAGDAAAAAGERGMLATDLMQELRSWLNP